MASKKAWVHLDFFGGKSATGWLGTKCEECDEWVCSCEEPNEDSKLPPTGEK